MVVIDYFRSLGLSVFANNAPVIRHTIFYHGVGHFQAYIHGIMQHNFKIKLLAVCQYHHQNRISVGGEASRQRERQCSACIQFSAARAFRCVGDIQNPGTFAVGTRQFDLILHSTGGKLVVLYVLRYPSIRSADQRLSGNATFQPCKGEVYIQRFHKHDGNVIENSLVFSFFICQLHFKGQVISFFLRAASSLEYQRPSFGLQLSAESRCSCIFRSHNLSVICQCTDQLRCVGKHIFCQLITFNSFYCRLIGCTGNHSCCILVFLPGEFQFQIQRIGTVQHISKLNLLLHHFPLCIPLFQESTDLESIVPLGSALR